MARKPRIYFSFRSPFSWMAVHELLRRVPDAWDRMEFMPFWDPDAETAKRLDERGSGFHYVQMSHAKHLYILQDTRRQAKRLDLAMAWPVDDDPWWEVPHLAWLAARRAGQHAQLYSALVAARWQRGEDICDQQVMRGLAESAGLDGAALTTAVDDVDIRDEGVECLAAAYDDDVFGIPYFRIGPHRFWGLDRLDMFLTEFTTPSAPARARTRTPARVPVGSYDTDTAGGCG
jgi:2-hydroxychromene-2-carboxylate isomerase